MSIEKAELTALKNAAYAEAEQFELPGDWAEGRAQIKGYTIDSHTTMDRDDAIWADWRRSGPQDLIISIADVGSFMQNSPAMEAYAREMGETRYGRTSNITMIPPRVSEGVMSILDSKKDGKGAPLPTPVISARLRLHQSGETDNLRITRDSLNLHSTER